MRIRSAAMMMRYLLLPGRGELQLEVVYDDDTPKKTTSTDRSTTRESTQTPAEDRKHRQMKWNEEERECCGVRHLKCMGLSTSFVNTTVRTY